MTDPQQQWWPFRGPAGAQQGAPQPGEDPAAPIPEPTLVLPEVRPMPGPGHIAPAQPPSSWQPLPDMPVTQRPWPPPPPPGFGPPAGQFGPPPGHYGPPPGHYGPPPGYYQPRPGYGLPPVPPRPPRRVGVTILVVILALVVGSLVGIGVVRAVEPGSVAPPTSAAPTQTSSGAAPSPSSSASPTPSTSPSSSPTSTYVPFQIPPTRWADLPRARPTNASERLVQANELYAQQVPASDTCPVIPRRVVSRSVFRDLSRKILDCQFVAWQPVFAQMGMTLSKPRLVIFSSKVTTRCGSVGADQSFYCPASQEIYLSESRLQSSQEWWRLHFANTLVHEFIHHVQNAAQILEASYDLDMDRDQRTRRVELQAYCLTNRVVLITPGFAFGRNDYQILKEWTEGESSRTHGSVSSRRHWWMRGLEQQKISGCNTWVVPASQVT